MAISGPSLIRRYGDPVRIPRALPAPVLITSGLIGHFKCQQGADVDVVYDETGTYNGARGTGGSFKPAWTSQGLNFAGLSLVNFPVGLSNALATDLWFLKVPSPYPDGYYQNISSRWNIMTDGRIVSGSVGGFNFSPSEVQSGNVFVTTTHDGTNTKLYFGTREAVSYQNSTNVNPDGQTWWGFTTYRGFQGYIYYRLCWDVVLTAVQVASQVRWVTSQVSGRGITIGNTASGPIIACCGDSITSGQPGSVETDWPKKLRALLSTTCRILNYGESGTTVASLASSIQANLSGVFGLNSGGTNVAIIARGTNDILVNGTAAATLIGYLTTCVTNARTAGATHVLVRTIPQANWTSQGGNQVARDAILATVNAAIIAGDTGADGVINLNGTSLGEGSTTTGSPYYDEIHWLDAGHVIMAAQTDTALGGIGIT